MTMSYLNVCFICLSCSLSCCNVATDVSHTSTPQLAFGGSLGCHAMFHTDGVPDQKSLLQFTLSLKLFIPTDMIHAEDRISRSEMQQGESAAMTNI